MMPIPKATICTTLSARRRLRLATPYRHATPTRPRKRPAAATSVKPAAASTSTKPARPSEKPQNSFQSNTTQ